MASSLVSITWPSRSLRGGTDGGSFCRTEFGLQEANVLGCGGLSLDKQARQPHQPLTLLTICATQGIAGGGGGFCLRVMLMLTESSLGTGAAVRTAPRLQGQNSPLRTGPLGLEVSPGPSMLTRQILTPEEGVPGGAIWVGGPLWISAQSSPPSPSAGPGHPPTCAVHFLLRALGFL